MRIRITKENGGHRLICTRRNGTRAQGPVGEGLPHHDLAHYAVEQELHLSQGFFGLINEGWTIAQLSDPTLISTLPDEALIAEVLTRNLQRLSNGAVAQHDFTSAVEVELPRVPNGLTGAVITRMLGTYVALLNAWENVPEGAALELRWR